jgi:hypothetical protein
MRFALVAPGRERLPPSSREIVTYICPEKSAGLPTKIGLEVMLNNEEAFDAREPRL